MKTIKKKSSQSVNGVLVYEKSLSFVKEIYGVLCESYDIVLYENIRKTAFSITTNLAESHATKYFARN
ncbi:four helix bundle protein [Bacillus sp. HNG]|uniref:four helix bundle protein n=1 Tax=Bacillus sp. HNG TaxID=2293325 RepID=UPI001672C88E|nr:four helix bundle protein [Bacillus sp. HNG]